MGGRVWSIGMVAPEVSVVRRACLAPPARQRPRRHFISPPHRALLHSVTIIFGYVRWRSQHPWLPVRPPPPKDPSAHCCFLLRGRSRIGPRSRPHRVYPQRLCCQTAQNFMGSSKDAKRGTEKNEKFCKIAEVLPPVMCRQNQNLQFIWDVKRPPAKSPPLSGTRCSLRRCWGRPPRKRPPSCDDAISRLAFEPLAVDD